MKMKKKFYKMLCATMACLSVFSLAACGGGGGSNSGGGGSSSVVDPNEPTGDNELVELTDADYVGLKRGETNPRPSNKNYTTIKVEIYSSGNGEQWLYNAATRFQKKYKNYIFESEKKGVYIDVIATDNIQTSLMGPSGTSATHIVFDERFANVYSLAQQGKIVCLDDVLTDEYEGGASIESRLDNNAKGGLKGPDGHYYALPNEELYPGINYDANAFAENLWYFAKDEANGALFDSKFGDAYFIRNENSEKSCGPDGEYGTYDDGLPSSIEELLILCDKIEFNNGIVFSVTGALQQYANYMIQSLWASLAGYEELHALYNFTGEVEVVTGYTEEPLFEGATYVKKPITKTVEINKDNAYLAYNSAARYYALAFQEIAVAEGWFSDDAVTGSVGHTDIMNKFVNDAVIGKSPRAFLLEGSYWYNQLCDEASDVLKNYTRRSGNEYPNVAIMTPPRKLKTADVVSENKEQATFDNGLSSVFINAKYQDDTEILEACKTFLQFLYSERELRAFTQVAGSVRPLTYELTESEQEGLTPYYKSVYEFSKNSKTLYWSSEEEAFNKNRMGLRIHFSCELFKPDGKSSCFAVFRDGKNAQYIMSKTAYTENAWKDMMA